MKKSNNYVYILDGKAYINLTNRCHNDCAFCIRNTGDGVAGTPLWLEREPNAAEVISAFTAIEPHLTSDEVVFCGYGEPTEAIDVLVKCARALKQRGYKTRLNTNGLGSLTSGRDIAPLLKDMDTVSVSLNNCDAKKYAAITRSEYGENAFPAVVGFARACKDNGINVMFTVVDVIGDDNIESCRALCAAEGIPLRVREYISDNYNGEVR